MRHDLGMKSKIHSKYKTKYRVSHWAEYDQALVKRGDITLWISDDAITSWKPVPTGRRGAQKKESGYHQLSRMAGLGTPESIAIGA
jgi:hypothetical protein